MHCAAQSDRATRQCRSMATGRTWDPDMRGATTAQATRRALGLRIERPTKTAVAGQAEYAHLGVQSEPRCA